MMIVRKIGKLALIGLAVVGAYFILQEVSGADLAGEIEDIWDTTADLAEDAVESVKNWVG